MQHDDRQHDDRQHDDTQADDRQRDATPPESAEATEDVLGAPFTRETIDLGSDREGPVTATLVKAPTHGPTNAAVLYVHGFCDYFFQKHFAQWWTDRGYTFYAIDLRKYGRSLADHQSPNHVEDLSEHFPELDEAYRRITQRDGHEAVVVAGHSTGGLIVPLWLHEHRPAVAGVVLNSPWLDMQGGWIMRNPATALIKQWGALRPRDVLPRSVSGVYGRSIHRSVQGEWEFNTDWKPLDSFPARTGWLAAVRRGHDQVHTGLDVRAPVLVLSSSRSTTPDDVDEDAMSTDTVLDVTQIRRWATSLGPHVTSVAIDGAMHDIVLSREPVRDAAMDQIGAWLRTYVEDAAAT
ncbi:alpha/beta hydrolase [Nocardioides yefusunii]|uniref:Alpha/beta hydrolase n=1 Tax=Nocardioides yefusunii TaxID=2500546 RepID=A0ABW1QSP6_9ACTN|nr:alpha/beta hydrolase [Nocardioides yefusunii]